jgi:phosphohistidine phosphatase
MNLYLVRHAEAAAKEIDPERKLTEEGVRQADALGRIIAALQLQPKEIWHSPKPRATQTAQAIATAIGASHNAFIRDGLLPDDPVKPIARFLREFPDDVMIVGHDPFLGRLASKLLAGKSSLGVVDLDKAGLIQLTRMPDQRWRIMQMLSPGRLGKVWPDFDGAPAAENP